MKTCRRFKTVRARYEREIRFTLAHSDRHKGEPAAKLSTKRAVSTKQQMARALSHHVERCPECG
ncbi:hypothetical protein ABZY07_42080 [Streptomyces tauricus]